MQNSDIIWLSYVCLSDARPQRGNIQAAVGLKFKFNNTASADQIPQADVVVDTLITSTTSNSLLIQTPLK